MYEGFGFLLGTRELMKYINLLTAGQGKWEATKKNPHQAINKGGKGLVIFHRISCNPN